MLNEERDYQTAFNALSELAKKDMTLAAEAFRSREAGDHLKAEAAETARAALVPIKLKAEENFLRAEIAGALAARESFVRSLRSDPSDLPLQNTDESIARFTRTFDEDIWRTEQQLAANLEEQANLSPK